MSERIVVGLSGGVDSALAAALLLERGFDVVGCFLKVAISGAPCPWKEDLPMAHRIAAYLNIPLIVKDVSAAYERDVLEPMVAAYWRGETPNPDTACNRWVKFDALAAVAREVSAEKIATGHYSRVIASEAKPSAAIPSTTAPGLLRRAAPRNDIELWRGVDHTKDQSYFLWQLTQEQLGMCEFPIGEWRKDDVRAEAKKRGLPNWDRESTSGVCFLGQVSIAGFLATSSSSLRGREGARSQLLGFEPFETGSAMPRNEAAEHRVAGDGEVTHSVISSRAGGEGSPSTEDTKAPATVVTTTGEILGTIPHAESLTIGQRVPIAGQSSAHYVVATDVARRRVVVGASSDDPARYTAVIHATDPHWIGLPPTFPLRATARIRHRQEPVLCTVSLRGSAGDGEVTRSVIPSRAGGEGPPGLQIALDTALTGVAPGQAVVFSDGDRVLGGAVIDGRGELR